MITLQVVGWNAWAPGLDSAQQWLEWAATANLPSDQGEQPDCAFLAPMQRRRLSRMARMCVHSLWPLLAGDEQLPLVFASRHGETPATLALLSELAAQAPLSPTRFGLSVHNAIAGQWSILRRQQGESIAIAGAADSFEHAWLEAALLLADGQPETLLVMTEELPPAAYREHIADAPTSYALALRLRLPCASHPEHWGLQLQPDGLPPGAAIDAGLPTALRWLRAHLHDRAPLNSGSGLRHWQWRASR